MARGALFPVVPTLLAGIFCLSVLTAPLVSVAADDVMAEEVDESIPPDPPSPEECKSEEDKIVIGATADFIETSSGFRYTARVDTGATTCSIDASKVRVEDSEKSMQKNVGKKISFQLTSAGGKTKRVTTTVADTIRIKTSDTMERRYKVWLTLRHAGVDRRVQVSLNDRSHMDYPLLVGRNFLCGKFLVDVETKHSPATVASKEESKEDEEG